MADIETSKDRTAESRAQVLHAYRQGVEALRSTEKDKDPFLKDAALWANHSIELFIEAFEAKNEGHPSEAEFLKHSTHPEVPQGYELPVIGRWFKSNSEKSGKPSEDIRIFFGLEVEGPITALRNSLVLGTAPREAENIDKQITLLEAHSIPSGLTKDNPEFIPVAINLSYQLQQLRSASYATPRFNNAAKLAGSRILILPL